MVKLDPNIAFTTKFGLVVSTTVAAASVSSPSKTAATFKKGIKRNPSFF